VKKAQGEVLEGVSWRYIATAIVSIGRKIKEATTLSRKSEQPMRSDSISG